jgi:cell wall-associated NlpC family hydrolase
VSRATVISRAKKWVADGVTYNQGGRHDGYRTDCSGYVSFTWGRPKPGATTPQFPSFSTLISKSDLKRGDILLNKAAGNSGHVAIFEKWANSAHSSYVGYELSGSGIHHRTITYPYFSGYGTFKPYRYNSITGS